MKALILLCLLGVTLNHVYGGEADCVQAGIKCVSSLKSTASTCEEKLPFFKCLRDNDCNGDDTAYQGFVKTYGYEGCGASAIIMGWTLPILMFSLAKYFSMH